MQNLAAEVVSLEEKAYKSRVAEVRATKKAEESEADAAEARKAKQKLASECIELKTIIANLQASRDQPSIIVHLQPCLCVQHGYHR